MFNNPFYGWPGLDDHLLPPSLRPGLTPPSHRLPALPRNPLERTQPILYQASQMPPITGGVTYDDRPGFWERAGNIARNVGGAIVGGLGLATAGILGGATSALGSGNGWGNSTNTTYTNRVVDDVPLHQAPPVKKLGQFNPNGFLSSNAPFSNVQTSIERRAAWQADQVDMRQTRARNLEKTLKNAKGDRLTALGNIMSDNNAYNPVNQPAQQQQGKLFNDVVSGGAQLGHNIWNGVNSFVSPGAYAHAHDPYSDTGVIGSRPTHEAGLYQYIQDGADYRNRMTPDRARTLEREREVQAAKNQILNLQPDADISNRTLDRGARIEIPYGVPTEYDPNPTLKFGEQAQGRNSFNKPMVLTAMDEQSLSDQLWFNYYHGEGQPIELNMGKLDFNDNINMQKYFENKGVLPLLRRDIVNPRALSDRMGQPMDVYNRENETHIFYKRETPNRGQVQNDITEMGLHFEPGSYEWGAFGQLAVNMSDVHIIVHHDQGNAIEVRADLRPTKNNGELDGFDFNPGGDRPWYAEIATQGIHYGLPAGTSFKIYGKGVNKFEQWF